jgi:hypothetical protein
LEQVLQKRPDGRAKWLAKALVQARPRGRAERSDAKRQSFYGWIIWINDN